MKKICLKCLVIFLSSIILGAVFLICTAPTLATGPPEEGTWQEDSPRCVGSVSATKIDQDGQSWNGVTVNLYRANGTKVASAQTPARFNKLTFGDYYITEEVPDGSQPLGPTRFDFTLTAKNPHFEAKFQNERICCGEVTATKVDQDDQEWPGVIVSLYRADDTKVADGVTPAHFENLDFGDYYLTEEVPEGSQPLGPTRFDFTLTAEAPHFEAKFQNERICCGEVTATKIDQDGQEWPGVTVNLYRADDTKVADGVTPARFDNLVFGDYYIIEEVPEGSQPLSPTRFDFILTAEAPHFEAKFQNERICCGEVTATKVDQDGQEWSGITVSLYRVDDTKVADGVTPAHFENLVFGDYYITEEVPANSTPLGPTRFDFTLSQEQRHVEFQFKNKHITEPYCDHDQTAHNWDPNTNEVTGSETGKGNNWRVVEADTDWNPIGAALTSGSGDTANFSFTANPAKQYRVQFRFDEGPWSTQKLCKIESPPPPPEPLRQCACEVKQDPADKHHLTLKFRVDHFDPDTGEFSHTELLPSLTGPELLSYIHIEESNFGCKPGEHFCCNGPTQELYWPKDAEEDLFVEFAVRESETDEFVTGPSCRLEHAADEEYRHITGQYQGFIGPVPFGTYTPYLEPGKEYFDMTQSIMHNVEYINGNQGDIVHRFNGQEVDGVTTSIFNNGTFRQVESVQGRAITAFDQGPTKLIAYRNGVEQARLFQTIFAAGTRWLHPLDQPFEHKYAFELELHGPPGVTDLLIYGAEQRELQYNEQGLALVTLTYDQAGLVAIYPIINPGYELQWITVDALTFPITASQTVRYNFAETGLYHYRLVDAAGQVVAGPFPTASLEFVADPGATYQAQLVYPAASIFVGLYNDMKFNHPTFWTMPLDAQAEHEFEFHLDYHRLNDPDLGNDHIRGDVVVEALSLLNATTSVAQQFPYGRHDGALPGVTLLGIPNVSMVAFCQRPGMHEMVFWGGWENESYYLPERGIIFDEELYQTWSEDQRGECIDAARRVNMELARQGLRTDHTYHHHGEMSQGNQMAQQNIWSPYNLVDMRPPHIGQFLKPGTILAYYEAPEDVLFWGWDLTKGGLMDGLGAAELQQYVASLGPVVYVDFTGIHPAEALNPAQPLPIPTFVRPTRIPPTPTPSPPPTPTPTPALPTPTPTPTPSPQPVTPTPSPTLTPELPAPISPTPLAYRDNLGQLTVQVAANVQLDSIQAYPDSGTVETNPAGSVPASSSALPALIQAKYRVSSDGIKSVASNAVSPEEELPAPVANNHYLGLLLGAKLADQAATLDNSAAREPSLLSFALGISLPETMTRVLNWGNGALTLVIPSLICLGFLMLAGVLNLDHEASYGAVFHRAFFED